MSENLHTLKKCPFCGGSDLKGEMFASYFYFISCQNKDCLMFGPHAPTPSGANVAWNTRAESGVIGELVEALEEALKGMDYAPPQSIEKAEQVLAKVRGER